MNTHQDLNITLKYKSSKTYLFCPGKFKKLLKLQKETVATFQQQHPAVVPSYAANKWQAEFPPPGKPNHLSLSSD